MTDKIISLIVAILTGLVTCIPLVAKLIQYISQGAKEKNWKPLLNLIIQLMKQAEVKFGDGATRKQWVMAMIQASSECVNYPVDMGTISELVDSLCDMTSIINAKKEDVGEKNENI